MEPLEKLSNLISIFAWADTNLQFEYSQENDQPEKYCVRRADVPDEISRFVAEAGCVSTQRLLIFCIKPIVKPAICWQDVKSGNLQEYFIEAGGVRRKLYA